MEVDFIEEFEIKLKNLQENNNKIIESIKELRKILSEFNHSIHNLNQLHQIQIQPV